MTSQAANALLKEAVVLDEAGAGRAAYFRYMQTIQLLAQTLSELGLESPKAERHLRMLGRCIERAQFYFASHGTAAPAAPTAAPAPAPAAAQALHRHASSSLADGESSRSLSEGSGASLSAEREEQLKREAEQFVIDAKRKNRELYERLKQRLPSLTPKQRFEQQTGMHRAMSENIRIADKKREEYLRKAHNVPERADARELYRRDLLEKRNATKSSWQTSALLEPTLAGMRGVMESISNTLSTADPSVKDLEQRLGRLPPTDVLGGYNLVREMMQSTTHPAGQHLREFVEAFNRRISEQYEQAVRRKSAAELQDVLRSAQSEVQQYCVSVHKLVVSRYSVYQRNEHMAMQALFAIEDTVMHEVSTSLLDIHRWLEQEPDDLINNQIMYMLEYTPAHCGVPARFCLEDAGAAAPPSADDEEQQQVLPYQRAIDLMATITDLTTPTSKARLIVDVLHAVTRYVQEYWAARGGYQGDPDALVISADDLIGIFTYVTIKAKPPCLRSQSMYIETFINEHLLNGEEGFVLATFDTTLRQLERLARDNREDNM